MRLRRMLTLSMSSGSKLGLVLYLDGLTPGNPLGPVVARKSIAWYWTIHEFGNLVMDEAYWACQAVARTAHATPRFRSLTCTCPASSHMQSGDSDTAFCMCDVYSSIAVTPPL